MLVSEDLVTQVDQTRLHLIYDSWPNHFAEASKISCKADHSSDYYDRIILCGMGGSATSCDILSDMLQAYGNIPSIVKRGQHLPPKPDKHSLVVVNSVSGNTSEALLMVDEASARNSEVICISAGGNMKEVAASYGHQHINIPSLAVPRASLPYLLMPGINLIEPFLESPVDRFSIYESVARAGSQISVSVPHELNVAKKISSFLNEGFAFCFASPSLLSDSKRFKNSLNENAKLHCIHESILESSHNEVVPFTYESQFPRRKILFLRMASDPPFINERFVKVNALLTQLGFQCMELYADDMRWINAVISSIYILDYSTIYMAVSRNVDPSATPAIDILKRV